jgi:hypothetical protein
MAKVVARGEEKRKEMREGKVREKVKVKEETKAY